MVSTNHSGTEHASTSLYSLHDTTCPTLATTVFDTMPPLDAAVLRALGLPPSTPARVASHGGSGFSSTQKITIERYAGSERQDFFLKTGQGSEAKLMFAGEHASLSALHSAVPSICPASHGTGALDQDSSTYFLVTDFLEFGARAAPSSQHGRSLAAKLVQLHTKPAPIPSGHAQPMYGFHVPTCCGNTPQANEFHQDWATFYAEQRLRAIYTRIERNHGTQAELKRMVDRTADVIVPRLLRAGHLGGQQGIMPVLVHGDLWSGNRGTARIAGQGPAQEIVFDPSCCYAHSEFELGIMQMFGGFGGNFLHEYHRLAPKTSPVSEYEDRVALYEL